MTKKIATLLVALMLCTLTAVAFATAADLPTAAEFEPINDGTYTKYTVVEYTIEDIGADLVCTVCTNDDMNAFDIQCNFYGDDQQWTGTYDGEATAKSYDKTGFMDGDSKAIIDAAIAQDIWVPIA